jgi:hypothetical protein
MKKPRVEGSAEKPDNKRKEKAKLTNKRPDLQTKGQTYKQKARLTNKRPDLKTKRQTYKQKARLTNKRPNLQKKGQTYKQNDCIRKYVVIEMTTFRPSWV